jgi:hypothetical protein
MDIGTQIDIALGVLAFLAAQAFVGAGWLVFRMLRESSTSHHPEPADERSGGALPGRV